MLLLDPLAGNIRHQVDQLIDRHHFLRPDIDGARKVGAQQPYRTFDALVNIEERACLVAIAPHLDLVAAAGHGNLATNRGWRLLTTACPSPLRSEYIVVAGDMRLQSEIPAISEVQSFAEQLFPSILAIGRRWIGRIFRAVRIQRVSL